MEIETASLSRKTRGILFTIAKILRENNTTIQEAVVRVFSFMKEKFKAGEFTQLIKSIDPRLPYNEIDPLMKELDPDGNGFIFFNELSRQINSVKPQDDPFRNNLDNKSVEIMTKSRMAFKLSEEEQQLLALKHFKDAICQSDPYQLLDIFDEDRDGFLSSAQFKTMLYNISITDKKIIGLLNQRVLAGKPKVKFADVLKALGIEDIAQRISFEEIDNPKSHIHIAEPIKKPQPKPVPKQSEPMKKPEPKPQPPKLIPRPRGNSVPKKTNESPKKENPAPPAAMNERAPREEVVVHEVPELLQPYYNPSSQLTQPLTSLALAHLLQCSTFYDKDNPKTKKEAQYAHILQIFGGDYYLFQNSSSAIQRDRRGLGALMEARNIIQGGVGDCYFMSAIAGVAEHYPELLYRLFVLDRNPASIYGIKLFIDGAWQTEILDACFPVNLFGHFIYAKPHNHAIWVLLLEKAWAKVYGSYDAIHAGYADEGMVALTGAPCENLLSDQDGTIDKLRIYLRKGYLISCSSSDMLGQMSERDQQNIGLFAGHAYTLLRIETDLPWRDKKATIVKVRNPWGNKEWKGDWSFGSNNWTPELKKRLNYEKNPHDGSFYMSLQDYMIYFYRITVCFVSLGKTHGHIKLTSGRTQSVMVAFSVKTAGDYFFSIYQESRRKYKHSANYKLSKSRLFLGRIAGGKVEGIASKACFSENLSLETTLVPGDYVISCKVKWNYHEQNSFELTSYGPQAIAFKPIPKDKNFLHEFIESKAAFELGEKSSYSKIGLHSSYKIIYMDPKQGFGYILVRNNSDRLLQSTIRFGKISGIKPIKPVTLPLQLVVVPHSTVVRGFIVDPQGFGYEIAEQTRVS